MARGGNTLPGKAAEFVGVCRREKAPFVKLAPLSRESIIGASVRALCVWCVCGGC